MPALAPVVTQTVADAVPAGTVVATLAPDPAEVDPGPFTYAITVDTASAFTVTDATLVSVIALDGAYSVSVTVTGSDATASPETASSLTFTATAPGEAGDDPYANNPNIPTPLPPGTTVLPWELFMREATNMLRPHARDGVDFVVSRATKEENPSNVFWDDAVLGPRPDAEIQALAEQLAAGNPYYLPT